MNKFGKVCIGVAILYILTAEVLVGKMGIDALMEKNVSVKTCDQLKDIAESMACNCTKESLYKNRYTLTYKIPYWFIVGINNSNKMEELVKNYGDKIILPDTMICAEHKKQEHINDFFKDK